MSVLKVVILELFSFVHSTFLSGHVQTDPGHLEKFQAVLRDNPAVFHTCRTATSLHHHWVLMGHNNLLNTQKGERSTVIQDNILNFCLFFVCVCVCVWCVCACVCVCARVCVTFTKCIEHM